MKQYIVEEKVIRGIWDYMPETEEDYNDALWEAQHELPAPMPTYPRGDNGKWKVGQIISEGVDVRIEEAHFTKFGKHWFTTTIAIPIEPEPKKDVDESALRTLVEFVAELKINAIDGYTKADCEEAKATYASENMVLGMVLNKIKELFKITTNQIIDKSTIK